MAVATNRRCAEARDCLRRDRRGSAALEFTIVALPFLLFLFFIFELSFDLFEQEALDGALQLASRQLQTGNAQNALNGSNFVTTYVCPNLPGLMTCGNIYISIQALNPSSSQDFYNYTTGTLPITNGSLDLTSYASGSFCNGGPSELLLISLIYVGPSFIGHLLPGVLSVTYNGGPVHALLSTVGAVSEAFSPSQAAQGAAAGC